MPGELFGYCQSLLRDPNDAADAVQDTFVIAASKLGGLRDPERLRAWLFAVARNECLHRLKSRSAAAAPLHDAPEQADESVDVGGEAERAEARRPDPRGGRGPERRRAGRHQPVLARP